jgi:hypothetical protein
MVSETSCNLKGHALLDLYKMTKCHFRSDDGFFVGEVSHDGF